jgi:lysophospholipase L1-like esterase
MLDAKQNGAQYEGSLHRRSTSRGTVVDGSFGVVYEPSRKGRAGVLGLAGPHTTTHKAGRKETGGWRCAFSLVFAQRRDDALEPSARSRSPACGLGVPSATLMLLHMRQASLFLLLIALACSTSEDARRSKPSDSGVADAGATTDAGADAANDGGAKDAGVVPDGGAVDATVEAGVTCKTVAHIGDSLTAYTIDPLTQAYLNVGVEAKIDAYGGRAIKQKLPDDPKTGKQAALDFVAAGFSGCWVVALGTNDTANVAAGAWYTRAEAIDEMMTAIDPTASVPVMWVDTYTTKTTGYWASANMKLWNQALGEALSRWPNMKIFEWSKIAETGAAPFSDGIHHTTAGYAVRNEAIAKALVGLWPP